MTAYADYRDLLAKERPNAAALAPVNRDKAAVIADCAAAGVHVYADKPVATSLEGVELISQAIQKSGTIAYTAASGGYAADMETQAA